MEIIYNKQIEPHNKAEIASYIAKYSWLIPSWAHKINVTLCESEESGNLAGLRTSFQYREINLGVNPEWFIRDGKTKEDAILHEICHMHNYQLYEFTDRLIEQYIDDENAKAMIHTEMVRYLEGGTQDLTRAILSKFGWTPKGDGYDPNESRPITAADRELMRKMQI
jgi:hypothetical protein